LVLSTDLMGIGMGRVVKQLGSSNKFYAGFVTPILKAGMPLKMVGMASCVGYGRIDEDLKNIRNFPQVRVLAVEKVTEIERLEGSYRRMSSYAQNRIYEKMREGYTMQSWTRPVAIESWQRVQVEWLTALSVKMGNVRLQTLGTFRQVSLQSEETQAVSKQKKSKRIIQL
jgi:hypothetical protein